MRKLLLTALVAGSGLAAFAQNTSTLNQTGSQQTGIIDQIGNLHQATINQVQGTGVNQGNLGFIMQGSTSNSGSTNNVGTINQTDGAKSNRAGINQNTKPASGTGKNTATINQKGTGAGGFVSGGNGTMIMPTTGVLTGTTPGAAKAVGGNWAGITQEGNGTNANATVNQNAGSMGGSSANFTNVYQNGTGSGTKTATVDQNNKSVGNSAILYQGDIAGGLSNTVQGASGAIEQNDNSTNNTAEMYQTKGIQTAIIQQNTNSSNNKALVDQSSTNDGNQAAIHQNMNSTFNEATINQTAGKGRTATIDQITNSDHGKAVINQQGTDPGIYGSPNTAYILQTKGSYNEGYINQNTYRGASATINQHDGSSNYAKITQGTTYFDFGLNNVAQIEQTGSSLNNGNKATIDQDYSYNTAKLKQAGEKNTASVSQVKGDYNVVKGLGSSDVALQQGNGNQLTITQVSLQSSAIVPNGPYTPNTASVSQIGNGNSSTITQAGY